MVLTRENQQALAPFEHLGDARRRHRLAEEITLEFITLALSEEGELTLGLDLWGCKTDPYLRTPVVDWRPAFA